MNYGTLVMWDASQASSPPKDESLDMGFAWMGSAPPPARRPQIRPVGSSFVVDLRYSQRAVALDEGSRRIETDVSASYSKSFKRLASGGNPLKDAKNFIAQFAGCKEASKVRGRAIALSRMRNSINGEVFRFPLEGS